MDRVISSARFRSELRTEILRRLDRQNQPELRTLIDPTLLRNELRYELTRRSDRLKLLEQIK